MRKPTPCHTGKAAIGREASDGSTDREPGIAVGIAAPTLATSTAWARGGAVLATAGCATLFNGFSQRVEVVSEAAG